MPVLLPAADLWVVLKALLQLPALSGKRGERCPALQVLSLMQPAFPSSLSSVFRSRWFVWIGW